MGSIQVQNLGKAYKRYANKWSRITEWIVGEERGTKTWVLKGVNFQVRSGEAVGIIGMNGAGKSTLLKLITGTTQPTEGAVQMTGRVAALLELGMGFHPDFTGRQNVFMAGQLLGYSQEEISNAMSDIEEFAEIGEYIDRPVRVYSSGMQVRLAFSVATAYRPEILIIDEALSVGDTYFQHKSFERIRKFRELGTTLLLVSHDKQAIQSVCDRAILLNRGEVALEGPPESVMDYYNALLAEHQSQIVRQEKHDNGRVQTVSGTGEATISSARLLNSDFEEIQVAMVGQQIVIEICIRTKTILSSLVIGYLIKDRLGQSIYGTNTSYLKKTLLNVAANTGVRASFEFKADLGPGTYSIAIALHAGDSHLEKNYEWRDLAIVFNIINPGETFVGVAYMPPQATVNYE